MQKLAETEHVFHRHNVKLHTTTYVTFSSTDLHDSPFQAIAHDLGSLISSGTWIAGRNQLQIHLRFLFNGKLSPDLIGTDVIEDLGFMLSNAEVVICMVHSLSG